MAAVPLRDEQSSKVITSVSTLPGATDKNSACKKDTIISSMYQSVNPIAPFAYTHASDIENQYKNKSPLNSIVEEISATVLNDDDEKIENIHQPEKSSWSICADVEEREKYVIDNVTSVCKIIQVDTEERIVRRTRLENSSETSIVSTKSSMGSPKNL